MLQLKNIVKTYTTGSLTQDALRDVSISFRENEFASILGPSGSGKTTLLNIVGGLDGYTSGDLIINGRSTKNYKDRDWDSYRNHSIGFVFQSYNLIPHQSILSNVELALTLAGISKKERRARAISVLEKVGLREHIHKKPNQMSGGQMQRVAIARALINNPDILLADEPTGALDSETSVQIMELLKEIAKDKLVIMVTHNPELAEQYSTRIIRLLDGKVISDTNPYEETEDTTDFLKSEVTKKTKKTSMSFFTALSLSFNNLRTKKARTALISFAGSIGIIGIALIFAVSQGMTTYINTVQEETLSSYPLTLEAQSMDLGTLMETFIGTATSNKEHQNDAVYQKSMVYDMVNALNSTETNENDLESFKTYLENQLKSDSVNTELRNAVNGVQYTYDTNLLIYTESKDGNIILSDSQKLMQEILIEYFGMDLSGMLNMQQSFAGMSGSSIFSADSYMKLWQEMLSGKDGELINPLLKKQYDVIYGEWPTEYNEIVLVVDEHNELDDMALYALGLKSKKDIDTIMNAAINKDALEVPDEKWSYKEICETEFRAVLNSDCYRLDESTGLYTDLRDTSAGMKYLYDNGITLKVSGIIRPAEDAIASMLTGSIGYTGELTKYIVEQSEDSSALTAQLQNPSKDIFTGLPFKENGGNLSDTEKRDEFLRYIESLNDSEKADAYIAMMSIPKASEIEEAINTNVSSLSREQIEETLFTALSQQTGMQGSETEDYIKAMSDDELKEMFEQLFTEQYKSQYAQRVKAQMSTTPPLQLSAALTASLPTYTDAEFAIYYDEVLTFSENSYESNLTELGYVDLSDPSSINIYASSFENKDIIEKAIAEYNEDAPELSKLTYTDYIGLMMSSVTTIINAITYVLIAFVAVSLIVSCIMIGVITLISVQERTKEIGILRAIGASKKNISSLFNAETVIIGLTSGLLGVGITWLLCIPINALLHHITGIGKLNAILPVSAAALFVTISVVLTLIAGIIPSKGAAKKDPVVALRSE